MRTSALALLLLAACSGGDPGSGSGTGGSADDSAGSGPDDTAVQPLECTDVDAGWGPEGSDELVVTEVVGDLATPWGLAFLPEGDFLLTERDGRLSRVSSEGELTVLAQVEVTATGEGGLLGIALSPDFDSTRAFFVYATVDDPDGGSGIENQVQRWTLAGDGESAALEAVIFSGIPARQFHNGGRLRIGPDDKLYVGTGDAGKPERSQDTADPAGKILRLELDGSVPEDNPFPGSATWIYGVRNTQGFDWRDDGLLLVTDHGPSGLSNEDGRSDHDEVSLAAPGDNLGWPEIYACEEAEGMVTASITWGEAMPPGGAAIVRGEALPGWEGDLVIGVLGFDSATNHLHRLRLGASGNVLLSEVTLSQEHGRLRDVVLGPDGALYVTTSNCDGRGTCGTGDVVLRVSG